MVHQQTLDAPTVQTSEKTTCLLVEDNAFVSDAYQIVLEGGGFRVCQVAASEPDAIDAILTRRPDVALVDIDIDGGDSLGVATALIAKDVPVAFVTGHPRSVLPAPFSTLPYLQKPVSRAALLALVHRLEEMRDR
jgi:CheY-like chemotaxis protein